MSGVDQLRAALAVKKSKAAPQRAVRIPSVIRHATEGTHVAEDGKPYTITYVPKGQN